MKVLALAPLCLIGVLGFVAPAGETADPSLEPSLESSSGSSAGPVRADTPLVDAGAVDRGLRARVGERIDGWSVDVAGTELEDEVEVTLTRPDGEQESRRMSVEGETVDDRSRELATALALIVDQYVPPKNEPPEPERPRVRRFFLGIGPRLGVGAPPDPDVGGSFVAGAWLAREHLMPRLQVSWSASWDDTLLFHGVRFGAGLGAGAPLRDGRLWLGAFAVPQAAWVQARDAFDVQRWISSSEVGALFQLRLEHVVLGLRTGIDVTLPPLRASGREGQLRWGTFRYMVGLTVGPRF